MHELWTLAAESLALGSAALLFVGALLTANAAPFRAARVASSLSLALGVAFAACLPVLPAEAAGAWIRLDAVSATMLLLVASLGALIVRYSRTYLAGDPRQAHYARWLLATLGAVTTLVTTTHLVVLALAWTATSIALHQLLTFYGERTAARVAAHKKFLVSRLADLCLWSGFALVYAAAGTLRLDGLAAWVEQTEALPPMMHAAAVLFVVAACLKSAQLPFHGWLTQVMEAPTPVSALLHAGVVNLGGLLMIRLSPLMAKAALAQALLVVIAMSTVVLASLVARTRVTAKGALAWSTCAQMGFMLVECGLGLWHLAMLHLVAHSFYKAHAFLSAGSVVEHWRIGAMAVPAQPMSWARLVASAALALALSVSALWLALGVDHLTPPALALGVMVALAAAAQGSGAPMRAAGRAAVLIALYTLAHLASAALWPTAVMEGAAVSLGLALVVGLAFVALFAVSETLERAPNGALARRLHPWLFAGFHLDERFTRWTFRMWPPRLPEPANGRSPQTLESFS